MRIAVLVGAVVTLSVAAGCQSTGRPQPVSGYAQIEQSVDKPVTLTGMLKGSPVGPIVVGDDFVAYTLAGRAFQPDLVNQEVQISGIVVKNPRPYLNGISLPYILTQVRWTDAQTEQPLPERLYLQRRGARSLYVD